MNAQVPYVIFTDLDGTLLDQESYSHRGAEPALERLQAHKVPLVFCTSQTRAEVQAVRLELGNRDPFIVENGGAIFIPRDYFPFPVPSWKSSDDYDVIELGIHYFEAVDALRRAAEHTGCRVRGFRDMSVAQVALRCHMSIAAAEKAKQRDYDEPFEILSKSTSLIFSLFERLEEEGLTWARDGRFYHVRGRHNKGQAARILIALFRRWCPETITVGLGDGPNDISLLEAVDVPIVIPTGLASGTHPAASDMKIAEHAGPVGWNQAVLDILEHPDEPGAMSD